MAAPERPHPFLPVLCAWLLPGAGHLLLRRVAPAMFVAVAVLALFVGGMALTGWENVSWVRHPYFFVIHVFGGLPTAVAALLTREAPVVDHLAQNPFPHKNVGELYTAIACLLNLTAVADVWSRCRRGDPEHKAEPEPEREMTAEDLVARPTEESEARG